MWVRVKICGITTLDDALAACEAGADALGFNFAPEAAAKGRRIALEAARQIIDRLPPFIATVGVVVNEAPERIQTYLESVDYVQFHGEETPDQCALFAARTIKAFRTAPGVDLEDMLAYPAAAYLLDAFSTQARGGTGEVSDWAVARKAVESGRCIILAGGLTPDNVAQAVRTVRPYAVDVSSGVEHAPGRKDHERMRRFIRAAKAACVDP